MYGGSAYQPLSGRAAERQKPGPSRGRQTIEILLLEDHAVVREGLRLLIENEPDMNIVAEASDIRTAVSSNFEPDVIVADLMLPDKSGPAAISALAGRFWNSKILVMTVVDSPVQVHLCLLAGARGYVLKEAVVNTLIKAIRTVNAGDTVVDPSLQEGMAQVANGVSLESRKPLAFRLTPKEMQLLQLIALGHTNAEAAAILKVSLRTVEARRAQIMSKLGLKTRAELIKWAIERGITQLL